MSVSHGRTYGRTDGHGDFWPSARTTNRRTFERRTHTTLPGRITQTSTITPVLTNHAATKIVSSTPIGMDGNVEREKNHIRIGDERRINDDDDDE